MGEGGGRGGLQGKFKLKRRVIYIFDINVSYISVMSLMENDFLLTFPILSYS